MKLAKQLSVLCFLGYSSLFSQHLTVNNNLPLKPLLEQHLSNGCVDISNISSYVNGSSEGFNSYGAFSRANSTFPLESGIVISTGNAASGGNKEQAEHLNYGSLNWKTDPDLETALGINNTLNATSIEFDFIAYSDTVEFNYVFASEEYFANYPCFSSDGFVFLIKENNGTDTYQNVALVPGTTTPITVNNIRDKILDQCEANNKQYFDGYYLGNTNFNGQTKVLKALTNIKQNTSYHIKLIVADYGLKPDPNYDTSVFINVSTTTHLNLGDAINTCANSVTLNGQVKNPLAKYTWYKDGRLLVGETNPTLQTSLSGIYQVKVSINDKCFLEDEISVTLKNEQTIKEISDYTICETNNDNKETFNLNTKNDAVIKAMETPPENYSINYFFTEIDAKNNTNNIKSPVTSGSATVFVRVDNLDTGCVSYGSFNLIINTKPRISQPLPLDVCDNDNTPDGITLIDLSQKNNEITGNQNNMVVSYHYSLSEANSNLNAITNYKNTYPTETLYIRVENPDTGCFNTSATLSVNVINSNAEIDTNLRYFNACDTDHDGYSVFNLIEIANNIMPNQDDYLPPTFHTSLSDAQTGSNPIPNPDNYLNTVKYLETIYIRFQHKITGCYIVIPVEIHTNLGLSSTNLHLNDLSFCDEDGDGIVNINLNEVITYIKNSHDNLNISLFETETDRNNNTPLDPSVPYSIVNEKTLYVTIDSDCSEFAEIVLKANPIIDFNPTAPITVCDSNSNGKTTVTLSNLDTIVTDNNNNYSVSYYLTPNDAHSKTNALPEKYYTDSKTLVARIDSNLSNCYTVNPFQLEIRPTPATKKPKDIIICDTDLNGYAIVNLTDKIPEMVSNTQNLTISFYKNRSSAVNNINAISSPENYNARTETIWVRVESDSSSCPSLISFKIIVNTNPSIAPISPYRECISQNETTGYFLMRTKDTEILNGDKNKEVSYFEDANFTTIIPKNKPYPSAGNQTIYVKKVNKSDISCYSTASFSLIVSPLPIYNTAFTNFAAECQNGATMHTFDFNSKRQEMALGSPDNLDIAFYLTLEEAEANASSSLPDFYTTKVLQGQFYARMENTDNGCSIIDEIRFTTFPNPIISSVSIPAVCDTDYDANATFDLTQTNKEIENMRFNDVVISYYEDENLSIQIPDSKLSNYAVSGHKTIYLKAENDATKCYTYAPLPLIVNTPPIINNAIGTVEICDNTDNAFDLNQINTIVVKDPSSVNISYHATQNEAYNAQNALNTYFKYTKNIHTIYIRIENKNTGCLAYTSFTLQVYPNPVINKPTDIIACDNNFDGLLTVNLSLKNKEILGALDPTVFTLSYYNSELNANTATNALGQLYTATNNTTVYARVAHTTTGCFSVTQFNIFVNPLPVVPINDNYTLCINDLPLIIDAFTGNPDDTYLWSNGSTNPELILDQPSDFGNYWVTVTTPHSNANNCETTKHITVKQSAIANIYFTTKVDFADPNSITVEVSGIGDYEFILDNGNPQTHNSFNNVSLGLHTITIRDLNGCNDASTEVFIIDAPKFFTPNNDGYFDTWTITGIEQLSGTTISIHDRYGKLLKTLSNNSKGWDGIYNGTYMPADDYWFVAHIIKDGKTFKIRDHFALKR